MIVYKEERRVSYSPAQMFALVVDVEKYPEFVPGCTHVSIMWRGGGRLEVRTHMKTFGMSGESTSKIAIEEPKSIDIVSQGRPFKRLAARWQFNDYEGGGCRVSYQMELDVGLKMFENLVAAILAPVAKKTVAAFMDRADKLYAVKAEEKPAEPAKTPEAAPKP